MSVDPRATAAPSDRAVVSTPPTPAAGGPDSPAPPPAAPVGVLHRPHRVLVRALLALALVTGLVAIFSVWANRQALNTHNWTNTSGHLLADARIRNALGAYLVGQLFSSVNVEGELQGALPRALSGLAGSAAGGLRELALQAAPPLLASSAVQSAWLKANSVAHREFLQIINGGGNTVSTRSGEVVLNLRPLIDQLAAGLGLQSQVAATRAKLSGAAGAQARTAAQQQLGITLPPAAGQLVILRSRQLKTAQDVASGIRGAAVWLTVLTFALFVAAVWLARGWRRQALRSVGWCMIALGVLVLLLRRVVGNRIIDPLVSADSVRPAAHAAWLIATSLLYDIAVASIAYGLIVVVAAWLAGSTRPATGLRRALAPELRERAVVVYSALAVVFLLVLLWGPTPAFRQLIPILGMIVLLWLGVRVLRLQTAQEFPDAHLGDTAHRVREWLGRHRPGAAHTGGAAIPAAAASGSGPAEGGNGRLAELERLSSLRDRGVLTDAEFLAEKSLIMNGS